MSELNQLPQSEEQIKRKRKKYRWVFGLSAFTIVLLFVLFRFDVVRGALGNIFQIFNPLFYGIAAAYLISPISDIFYALFLKISGKKCPENLKKLWRGLSLLLGVLIFLGLIVVLLLLILPEIYKAILQLIERAPGYIDAAISWYQGIIDPEKEWTVTLGTYLSSALSALEDWITTNLATMTNSVLDYITTGVISVFGFLVDFLIGLVLAVYIVKEKRKIFAQGKKLVFAICNTKRAQFVLDMTRHGKDIFNQYVYSNLLGCIIVFAATFLFMMAFNMPYALLISIIVGVTNFIPFFGPFIGAIPSAFILLFINPSYALYFIIFTVVIQQLEGNVITPLIVSDRIGLSPLWVTVAIIIGQGLFGFVGLLLAVPVFAVIYYFIKRITDAKLEQKNLTLDTAAYMSPPRSITDKFKQMSIKRKKKEKS